MPAHTEDDPEDGETPLMIACQKADLQRVKQLLSQDVSLKARDYTGKTLLHHCVDNQKTDIVELVLDKQRALINLKDDEGYSALHLAVIADNAPLVNLLLDRGASIDCLDNENHTVAHWATVCGHGKMLQLLQSRGAELNRPDVHQAYPIHYAAQMSGREYDTVDPKMGIKMIKLLMDKGVPVECKDNVGRTPLLWAASSGSPEGCVVLLKGGAKLGAKDKDGLGALHCAASRGHVDCMEVLLKQGADLNGEDNNGCTALFYAVTLEQVKSARTLLAKQSDPSHQDKKKRTPAHCAAAKGSVSCLKLLDAKKGNLWLRNSRGEYAIHEAALAKQYDAVKFLLNNRPDNVNITNHDLRTCLHIAAFTNNLDLCKMLVEKFKAQKNSIMTNKGKELTPLDAALAKKNEDCADYLRSEGGKKARELRQENKDGEKEDDKDDEEDVSDTQPDNDDDKQDPEDGEKSEEHSDIPKDNADAENERKMSAKQDLKKEGENRDGKKSAKKGSAITEKDKIKKIEEESEEDEQNDDKSDGTNDVRKKSAKQDSQKEKDNVDDEDEKKTTETQDLKEEKGNRDSKKSAKQSSKLHGKDKDGESDGEGKEDVADKDNEQDPTNDSVSRNKSAKHRDKDGSEEDDDNQDSGNESGPNENKETNDNLDEKQNERVRSSKKAGSDKTEEDGDKRITSAKSKSGDDSTTIIAESRISESRHSKRSERVASSKQKTGDKDITERPSQSRESTRSNTDYSKQASDETQTGFNPNSRPSDSRESKRSKSKQVGSNDKFDGSETSRPSQSRESKRSVKSVTSKQNDKSNGNEKDRPSNSRESKKSVKSVTSKQNDKSNGNDKDRPSHSRESKNSVKSSTSKQVGLNDKSNGNENGRPSQSRESKRSVKSNKLKQENKSGETDVDNTVSAENEKSECNTEDNKNIGGSKSKEDKREKSATSKHGNTSEIEKTEISPLEMERKRRILSSKLTEKTERDIFDKGPPDKTSEEGKTKDSTKYTKDTPGNKLEHKSKQKTDIDKGKSTVDSNKSKQSISGENPRNETKKTEKGTNKKRDKTPGTRHKSGKTEESDLNDLEDFTDSSDDEELLRVMQMADKSDRGRNQRYKRNDGNTVPPKRGERRRDTDKQTKPNTFGSGGNDNSDSRGIYKSTLVPTGNYHRKIGSQQPDAIWDRRKLRKTQAMDDYTGGGGGYDSDDTQNKFDQWGKRNAWEPGRKKRPKIKSLHDRDGLADSDSDSSEEDFVPIRDPYKPKTSELIFKPQKDKTLYEIYTEDDRKKELQRLAAERQKLRKELFLRNLHSKKYAMDENERKEKEQAKIYAMVRKQYSEREAQKAHRISKSRPHPLPDGHRVCENKIQEFVRIFMKKTLTSQHMQRTKHLEIHNINHRAGLTDRDLAKHLTSDYNDRSLYDKQMPSHFQSVDSWKEFLQGDLEQVLADERELIARVKAEERLMIYDLDDEAILVKPLPVMDVFSMMKHRRKRSLDNSDRHDDCHTPFAPSETASSRLSNTNQSTPRAASKIKGMTKEEEQRQKREKAKLKKTTQAYTTNLPAELALLKGPPSNDKRKRPLPAKRKRKSVSSETAASLPMIKSVPLTSLDSSPSPSNSPFSDGRHTSETDKSQETEEGNYMLPKLSKKSS